MYQLDWVIKAKTQRSLQLRWPSRLDVSPTVWKLGFTSLFTDVSSEMISSILPLYFMFYLRFSPLQFGILDGLYQGAALALLSLAAGIYADRWRRQKEIAVGGYALSSLSKLGLLLTGASWAPIAGSLLLDRIGKGIRTAPRDAMISLNSRSSSLATSFAVHRGLDTVGAVVGPLLAFLLLRMTPGSFSLVLMASFCVSLVGVGLIGLLVPKPVSLQESRERSSWQPTFHLVNKAGFRPLLVAGALLALMTASDAFIYLLLQKNTGAPASIFPLFAFITACVYLLLSVPAGRLADKWGRKQVFLGGYFSLLLIYVVLLMPGLGKELQFCALGLLGVYYAATDGVLAAMASSVLPADLRTSGLAMLNTVTNLFRVASSILFGWLWASSAMRYSVWVFLLGLLLALVVSAILLDKQKSE